MKKIVILVFVMCFLIINQVYAQNLISSTTTEVYNASQKYNSDYDSIGNPRLGKRDPSKMESMNNGKTFKTSQGINSAREYTPEYHGQKDYYNENLLRNDPEVLVSCAKHSSGYYVYPKKVTPNVIEPVVIENDEPVVAYAYLEDESTGEFTTPNRCSEENGVFICQAF